MKLNDSKIVIRPGKRYLIALFVYICCCYNALEFS